MPDNGSQKSLTTTLLLDAGGGNAEAVDRLTPVVYQELKRIAARHLSQERPNHTLQPTELVHEAYLRLIDQERVEWQNRAHFLAIASRTMRHVLVDHAKRKGALKRGGSTRRVTLGLVADAHSVFDVDILALDEALERLDRQDSQKRKVVELRYFGGLTIEETASVLDVSTGTVKRHWTMAKAWLYRELSSSPP